MLSLCASAHAGTAGAGRSNDSGDVASSIDPELENLFRPGSAPVKMARPFDTGPNIGRSRLDLAPLDVLGRDGPVPQELPHDNSVDAASFESILTDPPEPGRAFYAPSSPGGIVPPITPSRAYEFDSYEGWVPDSFEPPAWFPAPFLWPLSNAQWTYLQGNGDKLGFFEFEKRFMFMSPTSPIRIIPGFMNRYVSGPTTTDLPPDLAELSIEAAGTYQLGADWTLDAGIRPSLNGDFQFVNHDTFRMQGHAVVANRVSPDLQLVLGGVYLAREDIPALPIAGFIWQPSSDIKWELVFPRPRLAFRINGDVGAPQWVFLKGELGGNSWSIERVGGARDVATYRDIRLIVGYEAILPNGMAANLEVGWVTGRKLMYASDTPNFTPNDTFLVRAGLSF
jgi:hypothetical protein